MNKNLKYIAFNTLILLPLLFGGKALSQGCSQFSSLVDSINNCLYFSEDSIYPVPDTIMSGHFGKIIDHDCIRDTLVVLTGGNGRGPFIYHIFFQNEHGEWNQDNLTGGGFLMSGRMEWYPDSITKQYIYIYPPEEWGIEDIHRVWFIRDGERHYIDFDARTECMLGRNETIQQLREE